ncbi:SGNH/GDSL hydrolase family protein, partial [Vibrio anguillarum]
KQNIKLIAFGDSITAAGASPRTANGNYIYLTGGYWVDAWVQSSQQFEMLDGVGVSGNTTLDLLNRMDDVLLSAADVVMILIGTNDLAQARTPEQTRDSMAQILDQIISAGKKV